MAKELTNQLIDEVFMLKENGRDAATQQNEIIKNGYLYNLIKKSVQKPVKQSEKAEEEEEKKGGGSALE